MLRHLLRLILLALPLLLVRCDQEDPRVSELEAELRELRATIATSQADTATPSPGSIKKISPKPTRVATATTTPSPIPTAQPLEAVESRWIANTGGAGVAIRSDCQTEARTGASLPELTMVDLVASGTERCAGWSIVEASGERSWVRDVYLASTQPARPTVVTAPPSVPSVAPSNPTPSTAASEPTAPAQPEQPAAPPPPTPPPPPPPPPTMTAWEAHAAAECARYQQEYLNASRVGAAPLFLAFIRSKIDEWC